MTDARRHHLRRRPLAAGGRVDQQDRHDLGHGRRTTKAADCALELLGYTRQRHRRPGPAAGTTTSPATDTFRDPIWETNGYDLNIVAVPGRRRRTGRPVTRRRPRRLLGPAGPGRGPVQGLLDGAGLLGQDVLHLAARPARPRRVINPASAGITSPGDWRRRFFLNRNSGAFNPQADNNSSTTARQRRGHQRGAAQRLERHDHGRHRLDSSPNWRINYAAVLKWIKSGPQVLPPNLRAGRVLYYSSIPNDVNTGSGTTQQRLDKVVLEELHRLRPGLELHQHRLTSTGTAIVWSGCPRIDLHRATSTPWTGPSTTWPSAEALHARTPTARTGRGCTSGSARCR